MICVIPFFSGDAKAAKRLLRWIRDLGGVKSHTCLLVADFDTPIEDCLKAKDIAAEAFAAVDLISNDEPVTGWIPGSNSLFKTAAQACGGQPFLFVEPDATPLKATWADEIEAAYSSCGKPFMGSLVSHHQPGWPNPYMEGCGVYPEDAWSRMKGLFTDKVSWTRACAPAVVPNAINSPLFSHLWGMKDRAPTFAEGAIPGTEVMAPRLIPATAVLQHRCKDGSLINCLRRKLDKPDTERANSDLLIVFPFCSKDAAMFCKTVEWMRDLRGFYNYDALLSFDMLTPPGAVAKMKSLVSSCFRDVFLTAYPAPKPGQWPPTIAFIHAANHVHTRFNRPWFWTEYDMIPLKPNWIDAIDAEYRKCGKHFMGPVIPVQGHMNGTGAYAADTPLRIPKAMKILNIAWDVAMKPEMIHDCHDCKHLLQHAWIMDNRGRLQPLGAGREPSFSNGSLLQQLLPSAVIFHRSKDGTLIDRLRTLMHK